MNWKQLQLEALRLPEDERAASSGDLFESLEHEVDADAEAAGFEAIHLRLRDVDDVDCRRGDAAVGAAV